MAVTIAAIPIESIVSLRPGHDPEKYRDDGLYRAPDPTGRGGPDVYFLCYRLFGIACVIPELNFGELTAYRRFMRSHERMLDLEWLTPAEVAAEAKQTPNHEEMPIYFAGNNPSESAVAWRAYPYYPHGK